MNFYLPTNRTEEGCLACYAMRVFCTFSYINFCRYRMLAIKRSTFCSIWSKGDLRSSFRTWQLHSYVLRYSIFRVYSLYFMLHVIAMRSVMTELCLLRLFWPLTRLDYEIANFCQTFLPLITFQIFHIQYHSELFLTFYGFPSLT
jgi:hypothetical protein